MKQEEVKETIPQLWSHWRNLGIKTERKFPVLFTFYSAYDDGSLQFQEALASIGYAVERKTTRTMLFFKGYEVSAEKTDNWSVDSIQEKLEELKNLAQQCATIHEGVFARKLA